MKRAFLVAIALSLALPGVSVAQDRPGGPQGGGRDAGPRPDAGRPAQSAPRPGPAPRPAPARPAPAPRPQPARPQPPQARPPQARPQPSRPQPGPPPGARPGPGPGRPQPAPPSRGNQFSHRGVYHDRIAGPAFRYPQGYAYRRWSIGARLPLLFLAPTYYYTGWASLGLQPPPPGYDWVRYGPDLLLVNEVTGEVEDVAYGVFM